MTATDHQKGEKVSQNANTDECDYALFERVAKLCKGNPRVAILMSGTGSNARKILEQSHLYPNFHFVAIGTDTPGFYSAQIARDFGLVWILPGQWSKMPFDRQAFFTELAHKLKSIRVDLLLYAGFMKISPKHFLEQFPGLNIHPADLTLRKDKDNQTPRYVGKNVVWAAIKQGESYIASTVHVVEEAVDGGVIIAVSKHVPLLLEGLCDARELQEELKRTGEHTLYPQVLALLARGKITRDILPLRAENQDLNALLR